MSTGTTHDRLIGTVSLVLDRMVHVRLTAVGISRPGVIDRTPADPAQLWEGSRVVDPRPLRVNRSWDSLDGPKWRELELEGESEGPGGHWGSRRFLSTAHIRRTSGPAPFVLLLHGYAVPQTTYDRWLARQMRQRGAHTARLDLPYHLRRTLPGQRSGDGYFSLDPAHIRAVVRQSVEDAAAIIAWARAEVSTHISVVGVSLGGLIATLLAAQLDLDRVIAVAPFCDPAATLSQRPPTPSLRHLGMIGDDTQSWGPDRAAAGRFLDATLAPLVARNLTPRTPGDRITLVRAMQDLVVGPDPVTELAEAWQTELWTYPHGHMTVMSASGIARRIVHKATSPSESSLSVAV
ncbi:MAG TPA: YqiA/YcfP family alpha/beta fold hydrolase [Candidatus Saccharimonadales bacterium]|nr:YqiA/YcfP family alpha/beta fold hydrolase [Candidatus Saccharimonadales bacterium]